MTAFLRISTAEAVVNYVKGKIETCALKPGDCLPSERRLQEELGISRFALREGMARLNALGIIRSAQGKASVINADVDARSLNNVFVPLAAVENRKYVNDLFSSRLLLEVECAGLAAGHRTVADLRQLQGLIKTMDGEIDDGTAYARTDYELHHAIVEAAGNLFLEKIHTLLQDQLQPIIRKSVNTRKHRTVSMDWHRKIVTAIAGRNADAARAYMTGHLSACRTAFGRC